jgi:hypothetical protein
MDVAVTVLGRGAVGPVEEWSEAGQRALRLIQAWRKGSPRYNLVQSWPLGRAMVGLGHHLGAALEAQLAQQVMHV